MSIQPYQPAAEVAVVSPQDQAVRRLTEWAQSAQAAHQIAQTLVQTTFVPDSFRNKPGEATAAILAGLEVGLQPMAALRSFDVIQGQAAPRAITLRAIVQSHGHDMLLEESTATRCKMRGRRKGSNDWQSVTWTIDRAKDLGVTGKANWKNQPQAMLVARATSELARLIASDAILGLGYSAEEVADGGTSQAPVEQQTTDASPTGTRRMSRASSRVAAGPPSGEESGEESGFESQPSPDTNQPSDAQRGLMFASFKDAGFTTDARTAEGRQARLDYIGNVIGRPVESSNDLSVDEMSAVIDSLKADAEVQDAGAEPVEPGLFEGGEPS